MKKRIIILAAIVGVIIVYISVNVVSICTYSSKDETRSADVAIVLGASTYNGEISPVFEERINHAVYLYNNGYIRKMIITGGVGKGNELSDSYVGKKYAESKGIPDQDILIEETSTITQENLINAKKIMDDNQYITALIVSDPLHMKRAMLLAKDTEITAFSSPTKTTMYKSLKTKIPFTARETFFYIGYKFYRLIN